MPCVACDGLLAVGDYSSDDHQTYLFCPRCKGLDIESQSVVRAKTEYLIQDSKINARRIPHGLGEYRKSDVLRLLIFRINKHLNKFFKRNGMYTFELGYLATLIYSVYRAEGFGDKSISNFEKFGEEVTTLRDGFAVLHRAFLDAHQEFSICEKKLDYSGNFDDFAKDYNQHISEFWFAFNRILASLICGDPADWNTYNTVTGEIRNFSQVIETDDPKTVKEYGDFWYQLINQLKAIASMDPIINEVYFTELPNEITIFEIEEFLGNLDDSLNQIQELKASKGHCISIDKKVIENAGKKAFDNHWEDVRPLVIVGENSLDAHPFLFEVRYTENYRLAKGDEKVPVQKTEYVYPQDYARLVKYQIFPLLQNKGTAKNGHKILKQLTEKRSDKYEEQFYEFRSCLTVRI